MTLLINEIFYSIQGESIYSGRPCIFVRLTGCNLRCTYCDTRYAYEEGVEMEIAEIIRRVAAYNCRLVEITGGEPLLQTETPLLIFRLLENGYEVMMETNGSLDITKVDARCVKIIFVIGNRTDYVYAKKIIELNLPDFPEDHILFSPVSGKMPPADLAEWILEDNLNVRLHLQIQKIIWPDREKGV
ncbi:MAG: radical SAM protein [Deltaproteobacteria bacterium]|nr:radical SAM protein [Deltaproteobacteria bacterium]